VSFTCFDICTIQYVFLGIWFLLLDIIRFKIFPLWHEV
jgi:hypothetical protein